MDGVWIEPVGAQVMMALLVLRISGLLFRVLVIASRRRRRGDPAWRAPYWIASLRSQ
jgi:hypothetical protein